MLENAMKNPYFNYIFSFVIGMALVFIVRPVCNGKACGEVFKAPPVEEIKEAVYRINDKCYEFKPKTIDGIAVDQEGELLVEFECNV